MIRDSILMIKRYDQFVRFLVRAREAAEIYFRNNNFSGLELISCTSSEIENAATHVQYLGIMAGNSDVGYCRLYVSSKRGIQCILVRYYLVLCILM